MSVVVRRGFIDQAGNTATATDVVSPAVADLSLAFARVTNSLLTGSGDTTQANTNRNVDDWSTAVELWDATTVVARKAGTGDAATYRTHWEVVEWTGPAGDPNGWTVHRAVGTLPGGTATVDVVLGPTSSISIGQVVPFLSQYSNETGRNSDRLACRAEVVQVGSDVAVRLTRDDPTNQTVVYIEAVEFGSAWTVNQNVIINRTASGVDVTATLPTAVDWTKTGIFASWEGQRGLDEVPCVVHPGPDGTTVAAQWDDGANSANSVSVFTVSHPNLTVIRMEEPEGTFLPSATATATKTLPASVADMSKAMVSVFTACNGAGTAYSRQVVGARLTAVNQVEVWRGRTGQPVRGAIEVWDLSAITAAGPPSQTAEGTATPVGSLTVKVRRTVAGSTTPTGVTAVPTVTVQQSVAGSATPVGTVTAVTVRRVAVAGSAAPSGTLSTQVVAPPKQTTLCGPPPIDVADGTGELLTDGYVESFALDDTPADFASPSTVTLDITYRWYPEIEYGSNDDGTLSARVVSGTKQLAGLDAAGSFEVVDPNVLTGNPENTWVTKQVTFTYVNPTATKADWDNATLELLWNQVQVGPFFERAFCEVDRACVDVTYGAGPPSQQAAGQTTPTGSLTLRAHTTIAGQTAPAGQTSVRPNVSTAGSATPAGTVTTRTSRTASADGQTTPTGALTVRPSTTLVGSSTPVGQTTVIPQVAASGATTPIGAVAVRVATTLTGQTTPVGTVGTAATIRAAVAGAATPTGSVTVTVSAAVSGAVTPTGSVATRVVRRETASGSATPTGALTVHPAVSLAGQTTPTGVATGRQVATEQTEGSSTPTGTLTVRASVTLTGQAIPTGTVVRVPRVTVAAATTPTGTLLRRAAATLGGTVAPSGSVTTNVIPGGVQTEGSVTPTGEVTSRVIRRTTVAGTTTPTGSVVHRVRVALTGQTAPTGTVTPRTAGSISVAGTTTPTGTVTVRVAATITGQTTPTGTVGTAAVRQATPAGTVTPTGSLSLRPGTTATGTATPTGTVVHRVRVLLAGTATPAGTVTTGNRQTTEGSATPTGSLTVVVRSATAGAATPTGSVVHRTRVLLAGTAIPVGSVTTRVVPAVTTAGQTTPTGTLTLRAKVQLAGTTTPIGDMETAGRRTTGGSATPTGQVTKVVHRTVTGVATPNGVLVPVRTAAPFTGAVTPTGTVTRFVKVRLSGVAVPVGTVPTAGPPGVWWRPAATAHSDGSPPSQPGSPPWTAGGPGWGPGTPDHVRLPSDTTPPWR